MSNNFDDSEPLVKVIEPWFPVLTLAGPTAFQATVVARLVLGERKKVEFASDMHGAFRTVLREICEGNAPFLRLMEAEECEDFDRLEIKWVGQRVACRWGRKPENGPIRRNDTGNTRTTQSQAMLFPDLDRKAKGLPLLTLAYVVADDFTLAGVSQGWLARLLLCREWYDETEIVRVIAEYERPARDEATPERIVARQIRARSQQIQEMQRLVRKITRAG